MGFPAPQLPVPRHLLDPVVEMLAEAVYEGRMYAYQGPPGLERQVEEAVLRICRKGSDWWAALRPDELEMFAGWPGFPQGAGDPRLRGPPDGRIEQPPPGRQFH